MLKTVLRKWLPRRGRVDELPVLRADTWVAVECSQSHRDLLIAERLAAEQRRAAGHAEDLRHPRRRLESAQLLLALQ